jgi:hypothetical protein
MFKRLVGAYVKDEICKGKSLKQIRKQLLKSGYKKDEVDEVLRTYEYREEDLKQKEKKVTKTKTRVHVLLSVIIILAIVNAIFFYNYFSNPNYVLVEQSPTGLVMRTVSENELKNIQQDLNITSSDAEGLPSIS